MAMFTCIYIIFINFLIFNFVITDERINYNLENEKRWNTPPELIPEGLSDIKVQPQPRFLPFTASFTASGSFGNVGLSSSQSSSFSSGSSGITISDSNALNFGGQQNVNANSFAISQASSSSNGIINNNRAMSSAQSSVGSWNSLGTSNLDGDGSISTGSSYQENNKRRGKPSWTNISPNYNVGGVYMTPVKYSGRGGLYGAIDNRPLRLDIDVDDSQYQQTHPTVLISDYKPSSVRNHRVFIDEHNANVQRHPEHNVKPSLHVSSASASASSSSSSFGHHQPSSWNQNKNSGSVIKFPNDNYNNQNIQREFIRSRTKKSSKNPIDEFFTDLSDTVIDLFEF